MFGFNFGKKENFSKLQPNLPKEKIKLDKEDLRELPPTITEKGRGKKPVSAPIFDTEHQEEEARLKKNDPLRKFIPVEDISGNDDWRTIGERLDVPVEETDEVEETPVLSKEEELDKLFWEHDKQYKQEAKEHEELLKRYAEQDKIPETDTEIKTKFDKIGKREEKKVIRGMSPTKRFSESELKGPRSTPKKPSDRENIKTMPEGKKQRMARGEIKEFLDSPEGQKRILD